MTTGAPHPKSLTYQPEETTCVKRCNGFLRRHRPTHTRPSAFYVVQASHLWWRPLSGRKHQAALLAPWLTRAHQHLLSRPTDQRAFAVNFRAEGISLSGGALDHTAPCQTTRASACAGAGLCILSKRPTAQKQQGTATVCHAAKLRGNKTAHERVISVSVRYLEIETWLNTTRPPHHRATTPRKGVRATRLTFTPPQPRRMKSAAAPRLPSLSAALLSGFLSCISCSPALAPPRRQLQVPQRPTPQPIPARARARQILHLQPNLRPQQQIQNQHRSHRLPLMAQAKQRPHLNLFRLTDTVGYNHIDNPTRAGRFATPGFDMSQTLARPRKARPCCC